MIYVFIFNLASFKKYNSKVYTTHIKPKLNYLYLQLSMDTSPVNHFLQYYISKYHVHLITVQIIQNKGNTIGLMNLMQNKLFF